MTLTDTGPLVALLDDDDPYHRACVEAASKLPDGPMITTLPCFTEAMHLLGKVGGYHYQAALWGLRSAGHLALHELSSAEVDRSALLMEKYRDAPMDLADASLIAASENLAVRSVFTLDHHFRIYRLQGGSVLEMVP